MSLDFEAIRLQEAISRIEVVANLSFGTEVIKVKLDLDNIAKQILDLAKRDIRVEIWAGDCTTTLEPDYREKTRLIFNGFKEIK